MRSLLFLFLIVPFLIIPVSTAAISDDKSLKRLEKYFNQDNRTKFAIERKKLSADNIYRPLIEYWQARLNLRRNSTDAMERYILFTSSAYFRNQSQKALVRYGLDKKQWSLFQKHLTDDQVCATLYNRLILQQKKDSVQALREQWKQDVKMNNRVCTTLYKASFGKRYLSKNDVWIKIRQIAGSHSLSSARRLLSVFPGFIRYSNVRKVVRRATRYISGKHGLKGRANRELVMIAAMVAVRQNPKTAIRRWALFSGYFSEEENDHVWSVLGEWAARWHRSDAVDLLERTSGDYFTDSTRAWYLRASLKKERYPLIIEIFNLMSAEEQSISAWRYWRTVALERTGHTAQALKYYRALAKDTDDYYGLLAREKSGMPLVDTGKKLSISTTSVDKDFLLALALHKNKYKTLARNIWRYGIKRTDLSDKQRIAAAQAASNRKWYLGAIEMANSVNNADAHALRYPTPYYPNINKYAKQFLLDVAFVYGLMRQESRFMKNIVSSAGAQGLMQVMPRTALTVARKHRYSRYHKSRLKRVNTNLIIGTTYLTMLTKQVGDIPSKIAAGYNAGPGRAKRWFKNTNDLLITIENIPITETRLYVKYVLANRAHYQARLQTPPKSMKKIIQKPIIIGL